MKKRIAYLADLRVLAAFAVVVLHSFYAAAQNFEVSLSVRIVCMAVRNCMLFAVPVFVMVTGALLLDPAHSVTIKKIVCVYVRRIVIVLVLFSVIYRVFDLWYKREEFQIGQVKTFFVQLYTGENWGHVWYLYLLIGLYLMLPIYRSVTESRERTIYFLVIHFLFLSVLPLLQAISGAESAFFICTYTIYPFYLVLGYALRSQMIRIPRGLGAGLALAAAVGIVVLTNLGYVKDNQTITGLLNTYAFFPVILEAAGIFSLFQRTEETPKPVLLRRLLTAADQCSFGVYLVHLILLKLLYGAFRVNPFGTWYGLRILGIALAVTIVSMAVTMLLRMLPGMRRLL